MTVNKINKLTKIAAFTAVMSVLLVQTTFAQTITSSPTSSTAQTTTSTTNSDRLAQKQAANQQKLETRETNLKTRADNEINRRVTALNTLISRINTFKLLSVDQKTAFASQIQTEITNLTNLKTKIDADTDATTLKADVQSIITEYRVFAFYIPQIRLLETADRLMALTDQMSTFSANLQARISQAGQNGQNVTGLNDSLTDMQAKIADAVKQAQNATNSITTLTPAGYPANKTMLQTAKSNLMTGRNDLVTAKQDAQLIISGLKTIKTQAPSPTQP